MSCADHSKLSVSQLFYRKLAVVSVDMDAHAAENVALDVGQAALWDSPVFWRGAVLHPIIAIAPDSGFQPFLLFDRAVPKHIRFHE